MASSDDKPVTQFSNSNSSLPHTTASHRVPPHSSQAKKAVSDRTGNVLDDPDQLAALAVAVASSDEPLATVEALCRSVLDGVDVGTALKALLDRGKKKDNKGCVWKRETERESAGGQGERERLLVADAAAPPLGVVRSLNRD